MASARRERWFALGDINGFFGLAFDNLTVLSFLGAILIGAFGFPADIVYKKMFPGTAGKRSGRAATDSDGAGGADGSSLMRAILPAAP